MVDRDVLGEQQNYLTPEQRIPEKGLSYPWETCMTMGNSWSYVPNDTYKPTKEIIQKLVDIVSKGGNYLLNIGPGPDGEFDTIAYQRLKEIGAWIKINGEAIYGSRMFNVFGEGDSVRFTQSKNGRTKYIFLMDFPQGNQLITTMPFSKTTKVKMIGTSSSLLWKPTNGGVMITIPNHLKSSINYVWVLKVVD